ncbi:MAG: hypothetical protein D6748_08205 [Calditrichaeota bacterium]|nr:MAG: hypothetical protein D6748_08205 [Calditrichota bacterium]
MEEGFQWIWTMDDDVIPQRKALETQLQFSDVSLCIHPTRLNEDGTPYPEHLHLSDAQLNSAYFELNVCCFEGCLIHREILEKAGLPDERFFIVMDDKEYGLRVSQFTNIIYVRNARFVKQIPLKKSSGRFWQKVTLPTWKMYFQARNLFLLSSRRYRSFTPFRITYQLCRMVVAAAVRGPQRHKALRNIMLGIWDGIRGKFGEATWNLQ